MSEIDIAGLRALLAKATKGPWRIHANGLSAWGTSDHESSVGLCVSLGSRSDDEAANNAALIVAAYNALPALLDAYERAQGLVDREASLKVGDIVCKPKGYPFDGTIVAAFPTLAGKVRYVVDNGFGMLHIFNSDQLALFNSPTGEEG